MNDSDTPAQEQAAELLRRAAQHWSAQGTAPGAALRTRWWQSPTVCAHINRRICGSPLPRLGAGNVEWLRQKFPGRSFARGVSVGCGTAVFETLLIEAGLVEHFDLFEIAETRVARGRAMAAQNGLADRLTYHHGDAFETARGDSYDLVNWYDSLHHMLDVVKAIGWSRDVLLPGGVFVMDEFVGPTRMQYTDRQLDLAESARASLPGRYLLAPGQPGQVLPNRCRRPGLAAMQATDPTECADSGRILPALRLIFPDAEIIDTGGVVYHLALSDVLANIDEAADADRAVLRLLLLADDFCIAAGESLRAVAVAVKPT